MSRQGIPRSCMIVLLIFFQVTRLKNEEELSKKKKLFSVRLRQRGGFPAAAGSLAAARTGGAVRRGETESVPVPSRRRWETPVQGRAKLRPENRQADRATVGARCVPSHGEGNASRKEGRAGFALPSAVAFLV